jgi:hypothetical protein
MLSSLCCQLNTACLAKMSGTHLIVLLLAGTPGAVEQLEKEAGLFEIERQECARVSAPSTKPTPKVCCGYFSLRRRPRRP